ncbi:23S rRNA (adenine(1618)-N(6))-methyltransferase RlmF [Mucilaginibacter sp. L3T2-6]|uniref:23S rRNA (adenine(1618)-N(6))-methyltransferase RlmF n=1 Tax=Mucilaginibacter sp. L3T2-6 TaxID=3062491 RepID=UPI002675BA76|nr:23S rRNA (adenine(1618)-N(6))-methyltransferase RlmF [Mucilaginibacter sp. L3T2-6]MDO3643235.1 23S rRNA (adenine(1618)-N(6))-methyltransferase RlmF [Mucilaginibacter sp. L3T2-6]MDV6215559.1 23S rRNA (adenine(1618)-N(6))-methyltransferase RlmF [Mucilaginibacter sp. L3T2-6]
MQPEVNTPEKQNLHPRNLHRERYNFRQLIKSNPALNAFVSLNQYGDESIDFTSPAAVKELNRALLKHFYGIAHWDIPEGYLCPPIPGRADYIHYLADLLAESNNGSIPTGHSVKILDIGTGANAVYPLIGSSVYNWKFVGAEVDLVALASAKNIVALNKPLKNRIEIRRQASKSSIFGGIIDRNEIFDASMCNPPFHSSALEAKEATATKWRKLGISPNKTSQNFGGQKTELWYPGGEAAFITRMINESAVIPENCKWFTTLVSKKETLPVVQKALNSVRATDVRVINMSQGQKVSRILAWRF